jgi:hypothetical protein
MTLKAFANAVDPYARDAQPTAWRGWGLVAYGAALLCAAIIGYFLSGVPLQVSDNVWNLITVERTSYAELIDESGVQRPLLWLTLKAAADISAGHYFEVFRAIQIVQLGLLFVLVVRVLGVRTVTDAAVAPLCLVALIGFHTFRNLVQEAYPINTYLSTLVFVAAAMNLPVARPGWKTDTAAVLLLIAASLTLETGLLVWVVYVLGYVAGSRGVSRRGLLLSTIVALGYAVLVVSQLAGTAGELANAPTGYGFGRLEPQQVQARFGATPLRFWAYNVASSVATVLFAEPRRGTWQFAAAWLQNDLRPAQWHTVGVTAGTSLMLILFAGLRLRRWLRDPIPPRQRWVVVFFGVLAANAAISFAYTKDDIMSPSGLVFAVAVFGVVSTLVEATGNRWRRAALLAVPLGLLSFGWSLRAIDLPYALVTTALRNQTDWARIDLWKRQNNFADRYPEYAPFVDRLQREALRMHVPNPYLSRRMRVWDRNYSASNQ